MELWDKNLEGDRGVPQDPGVRGRIFQRKGGVKGVDAGVGGRNLLEHLKRGGTDTRGYGVGDPGIP